ncbi:hypothetical protein ASC77_02130 [Nocardioides sp. Root1257]|nr:hypothetical protein ASC77_02130 [Nocardioides sp. Root1257]KRC55808.1 hypothetical protein ASE24_02130 [Nocardioides sp. Root224]
MRAAGPTQGAVPDPLPPPEPVAEAPAPGRNRRRLLLAALAVVGVAVLVVEGIALARTIGSQESARRDVATPLQAPADLPVEGSLVLSRIRADGTVEVTQWIRSTEDITELSVAAPDVGVGADGVSVTGARLVAADGTSLADDLTVTAEPRVVGLESPTTMVRATYVLRGAAEQSGTVRGRVLARAVALDLSFPAQAGPTVVVVAAAGDGVVRNLACANAQSSVALLRPCGTPDGTRWRVRLPPAGRGDVVAAQVDVS